MSRVQGVEGPTVTEIGDANSILLLAPTMDPADDQGCARLLGHNQIAESNVLCVTLTDSPDDRMAAWNIHLADDPARIAFVDVGDSARSTAATTPTVGVATRPIEIQNVSNPGDLTGLGMKITKTLSEWDGSSNRIGLCFHSVTALLQYAELQRAFRFLHVLTGRIDAAGGVGHFHMDPTAHDEREINTLKSLFDAVVELKDGEWDVRSR